MRRALASVLLLATAACHDFAGAEQQCIQEGRCSDDGGLGGGAVGGGSSAGGGSAGGSGGGGVAVGGGAAGGGGALGGGGAMGGGAGGGSTGGGSTGGGSTGGGSTGGGSTGGGSTGGGSATGCAAANTDAGAPYLIYRSVGDPAALATGSTNHLTIVAGCATFTAPLPDRACVGDALQISSDGGTVIDQLVFLSRRLDAQHFEVRTAGGALPADLVQPVGGWALFRAYADFYNSVNSIENTNLDQAVKDFDPPTYDLVNLDALWNIAITADKEASDGIGAGLTNFSTDSAHYVRVFAPSLASEVGVTQRHSGAWDDTKARLVAPFAWPLISGQSVYFRIDGLQLKNTFALTAANESSGGIALTGAGVKWYLTDNIVAFAGTGYSSNAYGIAFYNGTGNATLYLVNNIVYGWPKTGVGAYAPAGTFLKIIAYNNTVLNNGTDGITFGCDNLDAGNNVYLRNNISTGNFADYDIWGATVLHASNNLSGDMTAAGDAGVTGATVTLKDPAAGDYRLSASDTAAKGKGADLSTDPQFPFSTDIAGQPRTVPWDLGASNAVP